LYEFGKITIDSDVWIGSHSSVVMNPHIGDGTIVGGNSLAKGTISPFSICVGSPAKEIKYRK
jgi:acetyltransferase-like isoleucine patch superfamily enzyme